MSRRKLAYGVGVNDWHTSISNGSSKHIPEYKMWLRMLERALSEKWKTGNPTYKDVSVDPVWHSMTKFIEDVSTLVGYEQAINDSWHLDKDLLFKGNKTYSKDTCCFIPIEINSLMVMHRSSRGAHPCGVHFRKRYTKRPYCAVISRGSAYKTLGYFATAEEAFYVYKEAKEAYIKEVANRWKDQIDVRAYEALMNYQVEITD